MINPIRQRQAGMTSVEFAIIGGLFFVVLFAVMEFGRLMYVMNTLDEVTRRGARLAAVCPVTGTATTFVRNRAIFDGALIPGLSADMVELEYLREDGSGADLSNPSAAVTFIRYVRASINGYEHKMMIPMMDITIPVPDFSTTIPSESLGVHPDGSTANCSS